MADSQFPSWSPSPPHSGPPRRHLVLVAALALAAVAAIGGLVAIGVGAVTSGTDPGPQAAPPTETAQPPGPAASEARRRRPGRRIDVSDLVAQVAQVRQLPAKGRLRARAVGEAALAQKVSDLAFDEIDANEVAADERLLVALRLAPPGTDLAAIVESLYREQILGLYVPEESTLYVKAGDRASAAQRLTTAHEVTHALQDRAFDLVKLQEAAEDDTEASLALLSLIEGDAVLTQQLWSQEHQTDDERREAMRDSSAGGQALASAPEYLRAGLFFPYEQGALFVVELFRRGGFAAVDRAFADPPTTSEQILHPEKYLAGEDAEAVRVAGRPGAGWRIDARYPFGEFDLQQMLLAVGPAQATAVSEGWGGGRVRSWTRDDGTAVALALAFDTAQDAHEACDALPRWYAQVANGTQIEPGVYAGDRDHFALDCQGSEVYAGVAADPAVARRLAGLD